MLKAYEQAAQKPDWLSLRDDILLADAQILELLAKLESNDVVGHETLQRLQELKRKLSESHAKMLKDMHQMLSLERVLAIMDRVGTLVRENVSDPKALRAIGEGLETLIRPAAADIAQPGTAPTGSVQP